MQRKVFFFFFLFRTQSCIVFLCLGALSLFQVQILRNFIDFSAFILDLSTCKYIQNLYF